MSQQIILELKFISKGVSQALVARYREAKCVKCWATFYRSLHILSKSQKFKVSYFTMGGGRFLIH